MKRICCFCERWESGGIESFLHNVLSRMDFSRLEVDLVAAQMGNSIFTQPLQKLGVRFIELSGNQRNLPENRRRFRALLKERHYDVLHLNVFHGLSLAYLHIAKQEGVAVRIAHSHNTALRSSRTRPLKLAIHQCARVRYARDATDLWACSREAAGFLFSEAELRKRDAQFIPNGIDLMGFRCDTDARGALRAKLKLDGQFVIGNVGRLCYQKNQAFLLEAFAQVIRRRPESCLLLVGAGEEEARLKEETYRLGVSERVIFYGNSNHVKHLLWAMDVFAFPSRFEGLPVALVEAQAAGLPVVCSEKICKEARIAPHVCEVPLSDGPVRWAEHLLEMTMGMSENTDVLRSAGFDIDDVSRQIEDSYRR